MTAGTNHTAFELIDRLVSADFGARGIESLYAPARALVSVPICLGAARVLADLRNGGHVLILTGSLTRAWISDRFGDNDGPIGVAALARGLSYGFNAIPVVLTDDSLRGMVSAMIECAGPTVVTREEAQAAADSPRFTSVAVVESLPTNDRAAMQEARRILDELSPHAVISVERAGMTADGTYRNSAGHDFSRGRSRLDHVVALARERGIPTVGIGDLGNEIGMGAIRDAVVSTVPHGETICASIATDVVYPCGVSNWGCYALQAALAIVSGKRCVAHTSALEKRLIEISPHIGFVDGLHGKREAMVDGLPIEVHTSVVTLLHAIVERELVCHD